MVNGLHLYSTFNRPMAIDILALVACYQGCITINKSLNKTLTKLNTMTNRSLSQNDYECISQYKCHYHLFVSFPRILLAS